MEQAFEDVIPAHQHMLTAYLYSMVRDRHLTDDLLQETFVAEMLARKTQMESTLKELSELRQSSSRRFGGS